MRKIVYLFILLFCYNANSQSLSVYDIDTSAFPTIKAKFFAFDAQFNLITNLSPNDFSITENEVSRFVTNVSCPEPIPPVALSSVLVMDVSGSMQGNGISIAKAAANAWINLLPLGKSECAITSFNNINFLNQDFTTDKNKLLNGINSLFCSGGTDYDAALLNEKAGGLIIAKNGKNKRVVVFLSDGGPNSFGSNMEIINEAKRNNIEIYCVALGSGAPQCMKDYSNQTGGICFENILTKENAEECYRKILVLAQGGSPCEIEWKSDVTCVLNQINTEIKLIPINKTSNLKYTPKNNSVANLEFSPYSVKFINTQPGIQSDTTISITAINTDYNVTNIICSNPNFFVTPTNFFLKAGQSRDLKVSFIPLDSSCTFTKLTFENDKCLEYYYITGGYPGISPKISTLKLLSPNGGEELVVGGDTVISWEGVSPYEKVKLEYSINNGKDWILLTNSATGLLYHWKVPNTPSNTCLVKITANYGDPNINICEQVWMGKNLDVEFYRNGDLIPEVKDPKEWCNLDTGAWCYYNNDSSNHATYGRLYNWYAVFDPRRLAPEGWHIPTEGNVYGDGEWNKLANCLGGELVAGGRLKSTGTIKDGDGLWDDPNNGATNESCFSGIPGGFRNVIDGSFHGLNGTGYWWSCNTYLMADAKYRYITNQYTNFYKNNGSMKLGLSVRCIKDSTFSSSQSDESDQVFSIVVSEASAKDIDMKTCLVGCEKDSVVQEFIRNKGSYRFRVDSIYFTGADPNAFSLLSDFTKIDLEAGVSRAAEFRFTPSRNGFHTATINIITQSDTIVKNIIGEGVMPQLEIISNFLNFGIVKLGSEKILQDTALIRNISTIPLNISNVVQLGPDKNQFEIISGGGAFTLQPNELRKLTVRYKPIYSGGSSGQLGFEYKGVGSPAKVQLFGTGMGKYVLTIKNDSAYAGQVRRLKLIVENIKDSGNISFAPSFEARIRFQKTILTPVKKASRIVINDSMYMNITGKTGSTAELAQILVYAGLGNVEETSLDIVDFKFTDQLGNKIDYDIETRSGNFKLLGMCHEGGTRLINPTGKVEIMQINPNPTSDDIEINLNLIEKGFTVLSIYSSSGIKVQEFIYSGETGLKTINLDLSEFGNGLYFVQLQTPTVLTKQKLMIIR